MDTESQRGDIGRNIQSKMREGTIDTALPDSSESSTPLTAESESPWLLKKSTFVNVSRRC